MTPDDGRPPPIVEELGAEFAALVAIELREGGRPTREPRPPLRPRRGGSGRVARRAATLVALLLLVGGVALASRFGHEDGPPADTEPAPLGAREGWQLSGYRDGGRICLLFAAGGELGGECGAPPAAARLRATSLLGGDRRFVIGLAGTRVRSVRIRAGGEIATAATVGAAGTPAAREAQLPTGTRWFVVRLGAARGEAPPAGPARVVPLGTAGRSLGRGELDCSLGAAAPACLRAMERRADRALR